MSSKAKRYQIPSRGIRAKIKYEHELQIFVSFSPYFIHRRAELIAQKCFISVKDAVICGFFLLQTCVLILICLNCKGAGHF